MSNLTVNNIDSVTEIKSSVANKPPVIKDSGGVEVIQGCRAWVNFNGTGTVAIRDSFNVSSITDNGAGDYTANFAVSMPNANFSAICSVGGGSSVHNGATNNLIAAVGSIRVISFQNGTGTLTDASRVSIAAFANN